ncbi:MFS transporter [Deinococcus sp. HMF7604]|uniref:MFS transporter n=1 Tax=Deinococcus betulae TaxID=2873312 RepID=UPI001CCDAD06|nr:MFS transporter [Deinococcus betulae]MBZ9752257.1 MFS transporter [Deinococcus betulae]
MTVQEHAFTQQAWTNANFRQVWFALSVSLIGSQITSLAVPLLAALTLNATPLHMGYLAAAERFPSLLFSLFAGVWVDRIKNKRLLMIWMDVLRAASLLSIPVTVIMGVLTLTQLYVVAFLLGTLTVVFEVAHSAYVPTFLPDSQILDGNSKLQVSHSAASSAGPGLGGLIVQWLTAPFALVFDALTYLASALFLLRICAEAPPPRKSPPLNVVNDVREGLSALLRQHLLGAWAVCGAAIIFFTGAFEAQYILYATRELHLNAGWIGLIAAAGGLAALPAAFLTTSVAQRFPVGPTIILGTMTWVLSLLVVPLMGGPLGVVVGVLALARVISGLIFTVVNVQQWSLRQIVTPAHLRGRVSASNRFLIEGAGALGAVFGGVLATGLGLRRALMLVCVGALLCFLPLFFAPLWKLHRMPEHSTAVPQ